MTCDGNPADTRSPEVTAKELIVEVAGLETTLRGAEDSLRTHVPLEEVQCPYSAMVYSMTSLSLRAVEQVARNVLQTSSQQGILSDVKCRRFRLH